jgi:Flp pilus assembly protein TadD
MTERPKHQDNQARTKPSLTETTRRVEELHEQGIEDADILQAMAEILERRGDSTLARRLANTAREIQQTEETDKDD